MIRRFLSRTWRTISHAFYKWNADDGFLLSAAMAYYAAFSLLPLCLVLIAGLGYAATVSSELQNGQQELMQLVEQHAGKWLSDQLERLLAGVKTNARFSGPFGLAMLAITAAGMFAQLERILDRIWAEPVENEGLLYSLLRLLRTRAMSFAVLLVVGALLVATLIGNLALSALRTQLPKWESMRYAWWAGQTSLAVVIEAVLLAVIYRVLPRATVAWRHALIGGLIVAIAWEVGKHAFEYFVIGDYLTVYGLIGSFMVVLIWVYYLSAAVFFGAEVVVALRATRAVQSESRVD